MSLSLIAVLTWLWKCKKLKISWNLKECFSITSLFLLVFYKFHVKNETIGNTSSNFYISHAQIRFCTASLGHWPSEVMKNGQPCIWNRLAWFTHWTTKVFHLNHPKCPETNSLSWIWCCHPKIGDILYSMCQLAWNIHWFYSLNNFLFFKVVNTTVRSTKAIYFHYFVRSFIIIVRQFVFMIRLCDGMWAHYDARTNL